MTIFFIFIASLVVTDLFLLSIALFIQKFPLADIESLVFSDGCMLFFYILFVLLAAGIASIYARQKITVTEQGITTRYQGKTMSIAWSEARFFSLNGSTKAKRPFLYELSSANGGVLWMQIRTNHFFLKPLIPFNQYQQQMNALSELVAAKTGLPLYDLRDTSNNWFL